MPELQMGLIEARFADLIWANAPVTTSALVKLAEAELHWKRTTTHTVIRRLCEKGLFENDGGTVHVRMGREEFYAKQSKKFVEDTFSGSLPAFLAAFTSGRGLTAEEAGELVETVGRERGVIYRPRFMTEEKGLTPAQRGTAIHQAVQYIPLEVDHSQDRIGQLLDQLEDRGFLTALQREAVSAQRLAAFFQSPLGKAMAQARECRREFKFSILVPAEEYYPRTEGEHILLQGVIDAWFEDGQGITVLDFKSDRIVPGEELARAEQYRAQLDAYARALSTILDRPVARKALWFFATDTAVEL